MTSFFTKIDPCLLSENELHLLTYIQANLNLVVRMSLHELASKLYVSDTIIVRFCQKLGLTGFSELKYTIKDELLLEKKRQTRFRGLIDQQISDFNYFLEFAPLIKLQEIVDLICSDHPLYIHGRSLSAIPAKYLHTVLNTLNRRCILVEDLHLIKSISQTIQPHSIILITSVNVPLTIYQEIFANAQKNQATSILITSSKNHVLEQLADYCLFSNDAPQTFNETDVNSRINMLSLVQLIIELASKQLLAEEATEA